MPFVLLPFRPTSDTSASRNFVRNFFKADYEGTGQYRGESLAAELRLTEPLVCYSWCGGSIAMALMQYRRYAALSSGAGADFQAASSPGMYTSSSESAKLVSSLLAQVVMTCAYIDPDSNLAPHAFDTFIPISVDSEARKRIIFDFFDLLSAVAARGKTNGMGGRKLSRLAGWWAFEFVEDGKGFDGGYRTWEK
jgi:hypothetical protein